MRKPVSKHALRRALDRVVAEGRLRSEEPTGSIVDRLWHEMTREAFQGNRRKDAVRSAHAARGRETAAA